MLVQQRGISRCFPKVHDHTSPRKLDKFIVTGTLSLLLSGPYIQLNSCCYHCHVRALIALLCMSCHAGNSYGSQVLHLCSAVKLLLAAFIVFSGAMEARSQERGFQGRFSQTHPHAGVFSSRTHPQYPRGSRCIYNLQFWEFLGQPWTTRRFLGPGTRVLVVSGSYGKHWKSNSPCFWRQGLLLSCRFLLRVGWQIANRLQELPVYVSPELESTSFYI